MAVFKVNVTEPHGENKSHRAKGGYCRPSSLQSTAEFFPFVYFLKL